MKRLAVMLLLVAGAAQAQVLPTTEWISVWSRSVGLNGQALPVGMRVEAVDPDGVVCGEAIATAPGEFGLMPVYRDDPMTPADEGADPGDIIRFRAAGFDAVVAVPVVWEFNGQTVNVHLQAEGVFPTPEWISIWSDGTLVGGAPVQPGAWVRAYDPGGVLCGEAMVHGPGQFGLMPVYRDDPNTDDFDEGAEPGDELRFEIDGVDAVPASTVLWTAAGEVMDVDLSADTVPTLLLGSSVLWESGRVLIRWTMFSDEHLRSMTVWRQEASARALVGSAVPGVAIDYELADPAAPRGQRVDYTLVVETAQESYAFELGAVSTPSLVAGMTAAPNPMRAGTTISIEGVTDGIVTVVDVAGREVRSLRATPFAQGRSSIFWDGRNRGGLRVAAGVYFITARVDGRRLVRKAVVTR